VAAFEAAIGHPDMNSFSKDVVAAQTFAEMEMIVQGATGLSDAPRKRDDGCDRGQC
jgi:hypothetical protein